MAVTAAVALMSLFIGAVLIEGFREFRYARRLERVSLAARAARLTQAKQAVVAETAVAEGMAREDSPRTAA